MSTKQLEDESLKSPIKEPEYHHVIDYHDISSPVKPSAPPVEWPTPSSQSNEPSPIPTPPLVEPLPPSARAKRGLLWLTVKLVPYHLLNFLLGTGAFIVVVTGTCLAVSLLPLCLVGVPIYFLLLQLTRIFVVMDIMLANTITRPQAAARWNAPDTTDEKEVIACELRIVPGLTRVSVRSTVAILYFSTVKFALGIASCCVVWLPFLPLASEIVALAGPSEPAYVAGWDAKRFNLSTHPVWFVLASVAYVIGGVALLHFLGLLSREVTRRVCCVEVVPTVDAGISAA